MKVCLTCANGTRESTWRSEWCAAGEHVTDSTLLIVARGRSLSCRLMLLGESTVILMLFLSRASGGKEICNLEAVLPESKKGFTFVEDWRNNDQ